jgi:LmbE family N-acetylglucosaminyl deacetylase
MTNLHSSSSQTQLPEHSLGNPVAANQAIDAWEQRRKILVILAHPDDPEFFCGASIARWTKAGHEVVYWLLTCGDKGTSDRSLASHDLCCLRQVEQQAAAARSTF